MPRMAALTVPNLGSIPRALPELYARYGRHLPALAAVILVVVIARLLAALVWAVVPTPAAAVWKPVPAAPVAAHGGQAVNLTTIAGAELFGHYQAPSAPAIADLASAPDTQLNLTLLGILADDRGGERSRALIGTQGGDEKPYSIGDDISRGVTLTAIFADRVILSRNGKLETLRLDKDAAGSGGLPPSALTARTPAKAPASTGAPGAAASLAEIRTKLLSDPSKVADYIRVQPVNSGGALNGYRIYPGKDRSIFTAAGLRPGDIVTAINGVPLNDPAKSLQLLSDLSQNTQLNLTVDRGGQPQNFDIKISP